jgi:hypothetical protein
MEGSFKRGWGADFYDEPGWQVALAGLAGSYRLDILRAGLLLIERTAARGDQARVRELAVGIAAALDVELRVQPGPVPWFLTDLRPSGARGIQRLGLYTVEEVVHRLDTLLTFEAWALRQRRLDPLGRSG